MCFPRNFARMNSSEYFWTTASGKLSINKALTHLCLMFSFRNCQKQKQPPEVFYRKSALKNLAIFTRKDLCWSLFLITFQTWSNETLLKRDFNTNVFQWIFWNILKHLFYGAPPVAASAENIRSILSDLSELVPIVWTEPS